MRAKKQEVDLRSDMLEREVKKPKTHRAEDNDRGLQRLLQWQERDPAYRSFLIHYGSEDPVRGGACWTVTLRSRRRKENVVGRSYVFSQAAYEAIGLETGLWL